LADILIHALRALAMSEREGEEQPRSAAIELVAFEPHQRMPQAGPGLQATG
jgi:hypothetical protein